MDDQYVSQTVKNEGDKGGASDGLGSDAEGRIYATNYEHNPIMRRNSNGEWETIAYDPHLLWPDTMSLAYDGYLYVTANQLHRQARFHNGRDLRRKPYTLYTHQRQRKTSTSSITLPLDDNGIWALLNKMSWRRKI